MIETKRRWNPNEMDKKIFRFKFPFMSKTPKKNPVFE